jgi:hypothetical protein
MAGAMLLTLSVGPTHALAAQNRLARDITSAELRASDLPAHFIHSEQVFNHYSPNSPATPFGELIGSDGYTCFYGNAPPWTRALLQAASRSRRSPDHLHVCAWLYVNAPSAHAAYRVQKSSSLYAAPVVQARIGDEASVLNPLSIFPSQQPPRTMAAGVIFRRQNAVVALIYEWRGAHIFSVANLERLARAIITRLR